MKYHVRYYDSKLSKKGKGTQVAAFKTRAEAEEFAGRNQIYSGPCRVELVAEEGDDLKMRDLDAHRLAVAQAVGIVHQADGMADVAGPDARVLERIVEYVRMAAMVDDMSFAATADRIAGQRRR